MVLYLPFIRFPVKSNNLGDKTYGLICAEMTEREREREREGERMQ